MAFEIMPFENISLLSAEVMSQAITDDDSKTSSIWEVNAIKNAKFNSIKHLID